MAPKKLDLDKSFSQVIQPSVNLTEAENFLSHFILELMQTLTATAPCRISFAGGGSDISEFFLRDRGAVVSAAISKMVQVSIAPSKSHLFELEWAQVETATQPGELTHCLTREGLRLIGTSAPVSIKSCSAVSTAGSGLGASSAYCVALLAALDRLQGGGFSRSELAQLACYLEIERCQRQIGKQDAYASSLGSLNLFEFLEDGRVLVNPIEIEKQTKLEFERHLLLFDTGFRRNSSRIVAGYGGVGAIEDRRSSIRDLVKFAYELKSLLEKGRLEEVGPLLHEAWKIKKGLSDAVTNSVIDDAYESALRAGASGGKLLGAGAGGHLLIYAKPQSHGEIISAIPNFVPVAFKFQDSGVVVQRLEMVTNT